jgi:hypothetical protein
MRHQPRKGPEQIEQEAVAQFLNAALPPPLFWTAVDNARSSKGEAGQRKAMGVRAGIPDVWVFVPMVGATTKVICFELKRKKARSLSTGKVIAAGKPSPVQIACHAEMAKANIRTHVAFSVEEVAETLRSVYGIRLRSQFTANGSIMPVPGVG